MFKMSMFNVPCSTCRATSFDFENNFENKGRRQLFDLEKASTFQDKQFGSFQFIFYSSNILTKLVSFIIPHHMLVAGYYVFTLAIHVSVSLIIPRHTLVAGYYFFRLAVHASVRLSIRMSVVHSPYVCPSAFRFRLIT